jgi:hypothetical protein
MQTFAEVDDGASVLGDKGNGYGNSPQKDPALHYKELSPVESVFY